MVRGGSRRSGGAPLAKDPARYKVLDPATRRHSSRSSQRALGSPGPRRYPGHSVAADRLLCALGHPTSSASVAPPHVPSIPYRRVDGDGCGCGCGCEGGGGGGGAGVGAGARQYSSISGAPLPAPCRLSSAARGYEVAAARTATSASLLTASMSFAPGRHCSPNTTLTSSASLS